MAAFAGYKKTSVNGGIILPRRRFKERGEGFKPAAIASFTKIANRTARQQKNRQTQQLLANG